MRITNKMARKARRLEKACGRIGDSLGRGIVSRLSSPLRDFVRWQGFG
jgi:hypothetical protein